MICRHWAEGGAGTEELARKVVALADGGEADFAPLYPDAHAALGQAGDHRARDLWRGRASPPTPRCSARFAELEAAGHGAPAGLRRQDAVLASRPIRRCAARRSGHIVPVREVRLSAGAGFVVAICGDIMTMPGLPREPAAERIHIDAQGRIEGLF